MRETALKPLGAADIYPLYTGSLLIETQPPKVLKDLDSFQNLKLKL